MCWGVEGAGDSGTGSCQPGTADSSATQWPSTGLPYSFFHCWKHQDQKQLGPDSAEGSWGREAEAPDALSFAQPAFLHTQTPRMLQWAVPSHIRHFQSILIVCLLGSGQLSPTAAEVLKGHPMVPASPKCHALHCTGLHQWPIRALSRDPDPATQCQAPILSKSLSLLGLPRESAFTSACLTSQCQASAAPVVPQTFKANTMALTSNPSTWEAEEGGSLGVSNQFELLKEFQASHDYRVTSYPHLHHHLHICIYVCMYTCMHAYHMLCACRPKEDIRSPGTGV